MKNTPLVIFDMDGTMLDTEPIYRQGWKNATAAQGITLPAGEFERIFDQIIGKNYTNCRRVLTTELPRLDFEKGYKACVAHKDGYVQNHGVPIKPGLFELQDKLEALGIQKCVATSTSKERAMHKLGIANIAHRFDVIVGGDEVEHGKPFPDIFMKAAALCGVPAQKYPDCLVLEDSAAGVEGGHRAGMTVALIPDMLPPTETMRRMANLVCKDLHEVAALF
jgi:HAD superfamily hydrolase (TIGR01509 family)